MNKPLIPLFLLLCILGSCSNENLQFPQLEEHLTQSERLFEALYRSREPAQVKNYVDTLIPILKTWENDVIEIQRQWDNPDDFKALDKAMIKSYSFVVEQHVESYIYREEILNPENYRIQEDILGQLTRLQIAMNRFMIQVYPIREVDLAYYKNLPEITSRTSDTHANLYFIIQVNLGYLREEKQTQSALNNSKKVMEDMIRSYCSLHSENQLMGWNEIDLKAGMMKVLNDYLAEFYEYKQGKMEGIKNLSFSKIQTIAFN